MVRLFEGVSVRGLARIVVSAIERPSAIGSQSCSEID